MLKTSGQRKNHSQVNFKVNLLTRCDREFAQHSEKFSVHTVTNSYGKVYTSHGKRLEEHSLVTREYILHFSVEGAQGRSLEGIQTSTLRW